MASGNKSESSETGRSKFKIHTLATKHHRLYTISVLMVALFGYLMLLTPVLFTLIGLFGAVYTIATEPSSTLATIFWIVVFLIGAIGGYYIGALKFGSHIGVRLPREKCPKLYEWIDSQEQLIEGAAHISEIQLSDRHELSLVRIPICGPIPGSKYILVIGFSVLQGLPKPYFERMLASKLLQLSRRKYGLSHWLISLCHVWPQYLSALHRRNGPGDRQLGQLINRYAVFYRRMTLPLIKKAHLRGDEYIHHNLDAYELIETIQVDMVVDLFIRLHYWPHIARVVKESSGQSSDLHPFANIPKVIAKTLTSEVLVKSSKALYDTPRLAADRYPPLKQRIENLGHVRPVALKPWKGTAARHFLGDHYPGYVTLMERYWMAKHGIAPHEKQMDEQPATAASTDAIDEPAEAVT